MRKKITITILVGLGLFFGATQVLAQTSTYDFSTGVGTNKWAYDIISSSYNIPQLPEAFDIEIELTGIEYSYIEDSNNIRFETYDDDGYSGLELKFKINETIIDITQIDFLIEGQRHEDYYFKLWVFNYNTNSWEFLSENSTETYDVEYTGQKTSNFENYIDENNYLWVLGLYSRFYYHFDIDYVKIVVNYLPEEVITLTDIYTLIQNDETGAEFYVKKTLTYGEAIIIWFLTIFLIIMIFQIAYNFFWKK